MTLYFADGTARGFAKFLQDQLRPRSALFADSTRKAFYALQYSTDGAAVQTCLG
jgi:hypothetical protein